MQITQDYSGSPIVTVQRMGEFNFSDIFDKVLDTGTKIYATKAQLDQQKREYEIAKLQAQQQSYSPNFDFSTPNSPIYGGGLLPQSNNLMPILLLGGLGVAAFLLLRK